MNLLSYCTVKFFRQRPKSDDHLHIKKNKRFFILLSRKNCCEILFNNCTLHPHMKVMRLGLENLINHLASRGDFPPVILIQPEKENLSPDEKNAAKQFTANIATLCKERNWEHYPCLLDGRENGIFSGSATLNAIARLYPNHANEEHEFYLIDDGQQEKFDIPVNFKHIRLRHFQFDWCDELKQKEIEQSRAESTYSSVRLFRDHYELALVTMTAALTVATVVTSINNLTK